MIEHNPCEKLSDVKDIAKVLWKMNKKIKKERASREMKDNEEYELLVRNSIELTNKNKDMVDYCLLQLYNGIKDGEEKVRIYYSKLVGIDNYCVIQKTLKEMGIEFKPLSSFAVCKIGDVGFNKS